MRQIRWLRALAAGCLSELCLIAVFIPTTAFVGEKPGVAVAVVGSFVMPLLWGMWTARRVTAQFVLHGVIVGAVGVVMYIVLTMGAPERALYIFAHFLKLAGGAAGGYVGALLPSRMKSAVSI